MHHFSKTIKKESNQQVFGIRAVIEAINSGKEIESLFIQRGLSGELLKELKELIKERAISYQQVPAEKLDRITRKNHQGVIAVISPITYQKIEDIIPAIYEEGRTPFLLVLDGITDVRNFGAIARTAACAGVDALIVPARGSAEINPDAIKTSAGALFKIPVCRHESLAQVVKFMQDSGIQVVACTEKTESSIYVPDFNLPTAVVMGAEDIGISDAILRNADHLAKIPMFGEIASLNVSVSAGIVLYEVIRQRFN